MKKIIFLDFDGVLNSIEWYTTDNENRTKGSFDPECIRRLNQIIEETGAKIVLSTSWRSDPDIVDLVKAIGIKGEVIGKTDYLNNSFIVRGNEIKKWLSDNKLYTYSDPTLNRSPGFRYIILDDDGDMLLEQKHNFIHVDPEIGLCDADVEQAIQILNS